MRTIFAAVIFIVIANSVYASQEFRPKNIPLPAQASSSLPAGLSAECRDFISTLAPEFSYGFLDVPENWNDPHSPKIQVFYYAGNLDRQRTPIVFFNGGPGFSSHGLAAIWKSYLPMVGVPFVTFDQRGTGCSSNYPQAVDAQSFSRLQYYGSRGIVHDAEAVRRLLFGNRSWKIFGQSYGGFVVHRYLTMFPHSIVSAHAHGLALTRHRFGDYYFRVLGQQRIVERYFTEHPQDRARVMRIHNLLNDRDCFTRGSFTVCGRGTWDGILTNLLGANRAAELPQILNELLPPQGFDRTLFADLVEQHIYPLYAPMESATPAVVTTSPQVLMTGPGYIGLMEVGTDPIYPNDPSNCMAINEYLANTIPLDTMAVNECRFVLAQRYSIVSSLNAVVSPQASALPPVALDRLSLDSFAASVKANRQVPFYLYSGALDTLVPTEIFAEETTELTGLIRYYDFPNSAHEGFISEPQIWSDLLLTE